MNYIKTTKYDISNGTGIRVVLWTAGCSHHCKGCHNPETWDENSGKKFDESSLNELLNDLGKDYISGLTFSGGDPLYVNSRGTILKIAKAVKEKYHNKDIWLWTGYLWEDICDLEILKYIDVLIDGEFQLPLKDMRLKNRGSSNQRVIDVAKSLECGEVCLYCE